jgi:S-adenosylmethionine decarboxylase
MHLTIDGFGGNPQKLASEELVRNLLDRLPESIGMTKITVPHVQKYAGDKPEDWGVSGFVMIAESHLSIHTFPERNIVWADLFSCKGFDTDSAVEHLRQAFDLEGVHARRIPRGLEYELGPDIVAEEEAGPELVLAST